MQDRAHISRTHRYEDPFKRFFRVFLGNPLRTSAQQKECLGFFLGLPILAVDALSSIAYASEEVLLALSVLGTGYFPFSIPISIAITLLITILVISYMQTVVAYPNGGGAYTVARDHLGAKSALVAAASLMVDYILTVAVSVSAGVRAITSAFPLFKSSSVLLATSIIFALTWVNLRGIRESAHAVAIPVYAFIFFMIMLCCSGLFVGFTVPPVPKEAFISDPVLDLAALLIILRAFAGGCTAMTGIEVIANAGSILKKPHDVFARRILMTLGALLCFCFLSITLTVNHLALSPGPNESLISQMTRYIWGDGILHETVQLLTATVLFLAANSAYAGFPKLAAILATDGWMPKQFAALGDRLVFSQGILWLALSASVLVILFEANTHALIPLYAVGVFTAFTLSQSGMVRYWWRERGEYIQKMTTGSSNSRKALSYKKEVLGYLRRMIINGFGAFCTFLALLVTFEAKFTEGAYLVMVVVPLLCFIFNGISKHYKSVSADLRLDKSYIKKCKPEFATTSRQTVVVPISKLNKGSLEAIAFARSLSRDVRILIVDANQESLETIIVEVEALKWGVKCIPIKSPYRAVIQPIVEYVHQVDMDKKALAVLVLPELVPSKWYQGILHNQTSGRIAKLMSWNENIPNKARIVINVPFYLE